MKRLRLAAYGFLALTLFLAIAPGRSQEPEHSEQNATAAKSVRESPEPSDHFAWKEAGREINGVFPNLSVRAPGAGSSSEAGIGALIPWADRLWAVGYVAHIHGSGIGLYEIKRRPLDPHAPRVRHRHLRQPHDPLGDEAGGHRPPPHRRNRQRPHDRRTRASTVWPRPPGT